MKSNRTASLLLIETIFAVFFFALASTICVQFYLRSHRLSERAAVKTEAVLLSQSLAESFLAAKGDVQECARLISTVPGIRVTENDPAQQRIALESENGLTASLQIGGDAPLAEGNIEVYAGAKDQSDGPVISLPVRVFTGVLPGGEHAQK
ncbi:MAG: hypothetical protein J6I56_00530 [Lachnospiraceae bacterium]|nr:hypothetical protein [Lachnospiraceae bacterium]